MKCGYDFHIMEWIKICKEQTHKVLKIYNLRLKGTKTYKFKEAFEPLNFFMWKQTGKLILLQTWSIFYVKEVQNQEIIMWNRDEKLL